MKNIFIIGSKGIPAKYGGFETFVDQLTARRENEGIRYHVSCLADNDEEFEHHSARCFNVKVKKIGGATAVLYDVLSMKRCISYIERERLSDCIVYVLACRIGPFFYYFKRRLEKLGARVFVNPDGHEWKRSKWNAFIRRYWKYSERLMVKQADLLVCDSKGIQSYILDEYASYRPRTRFIAYGADVAPSSLDGDSALLTEWYARHGVSAGDYYLVVGRFVPENNYECVIREFMRSDTGKDLVIVTNFEKNAYYEELLRKTSFDNDRRIKFVGTVYDQQLLKKIREEAFGYFHGHEVGGTNPSLLEALASTRLNLLLDVVFNREVALDGAVYFTKREGDLARLIQGAEAFGPERITELHATAKGRIVREYSWTRIVEDYERVFLEPSFESAEEPRANRKPNPVVDMQSYEGGWK